MVHKKGGRYSALQASLRHTTRTLAAAAVMVKAAAAVTVAAAATMVVQLSPSATLAVWT